MKRSTLWVAVIGLLTGAAQAGDPVATSASATPPTRIEMGTAETMENPSVIMARRAQQAKAKDVEPYYDDTLDSAKTAVDTAYKAAKAKNGTLTKSAWVKTLATATDATSIYLLGATQWLGIGGPMKFAEAQKNFEAAAALGSIAGKREYAKMILRGHVEKGQSQRGYELMTAIASADADAMVERGIALTDGYGVTKDRAEARKCFEAAAAKGSSRANLWLATLTTIQPDITPEQKTAAVAYAKKASDAGQVKAMRMYGMMVDQGYGVTKDQVTGSALILKAALAGEQDAQFIMAQKYRYGIGVNQDPVEALSWARTCAQYNNVQCMQSAGELVLEVQPDGGDAMIKEAVRYVINMSTRDEAAAKSLVETLQSGTTMPFSELMRLAGYNQ